MARIIPILGSLRGSLGGDTFSHNKGGDYVRRRSTPTNPQTSRQQTTRSLVSQYAQGWMGILDATQRQAWEDYAATHPVKNSQGQDVLISGLAWYVKCNTVLDDAGATPITSPPVDGAPASLGSLSIALTGASAADVTYSPAIGGTDRVQLWESLPVSQGSSPNKAQCRLTGYSSAGQASPWSVTLLGAYATGTRLVVYAGVMSDEGLFSAYLQAYDNS